MALNQEERDALELIAVDLETASTWHSGQRESTLLGLAAKVRQVAAGDGSALVADAKAEEERQAEIEAARQQVEDAQVAAEKAAQKAADKAAKQ